jgi:hypothetical protein
VITRWRFLSQPPYRSRDRDYIGFTIAEVEEAIHTVPWQRTELGRLDCRKDFPYGKEWNRKSYATKQVRPVFVEEVAEIVVVTVYTYCF